MGCKNSNARGTSHRHRYWRDQRWSPLVQAPETAAPSIPLKRLFKNGRPSIDGEYIALFPDGLLYQITYENGNSWAFYNDTNHWDMWVTYVFGPGSDIVALGKTQYTAQNDGRHHCFLLLHPGETSPFITGKPNGYRISFQRLHSAPLSEEYEAILCAEVACRLKQELEVVLGLYKGDMNDLIKECVRTSTPFVDVTFPPTKESLFREGEQKLDVITWKRSKDFVKESGKIALVFFSCDPNDIGQGELGDEWFLCSLAAVAEFPEHIRAILRHPQCETEKEAEEAVGCYRIRLNKNGWYTDVILDDCLPVSGPLPCFAKNVEERGELWVSLIEKAYAKMHGSYSALVERGDPLEGMADLTGSPYIRLDKEWNVASQNSLVRAYLFRRLLAYHAEKFLITVSTPGIKNSLLAPKTTPQKTLQRNTDALGLTWDMPTPCWSASTLRRKGYR